MVVRKGLLPIFNVSTSVGELRSMTRDDALCPGRVCFLSHRTLALCIPWLSSSIHLRIAPDLYRRGAACITIALVVPLLGVGPGCGVRGMAHCVLGGFPLSRDRVPIALCG